MPAQSKPSEQPAPLPTTEIQVDQQKTLDKYRLIKHQEYTIGVEDLIEVFVYNDQSLNTIQAVRPDGKISIPLVGEIAVEGLSVSKVQESLEKKFARYFVRPQVNVIIKDYRSRKIYILGEVNTPGIYRLAGQADMLEALSLAKGTTEKADFRGSYMIRDKEFVPVDFYKLINLGDLNQNIPVSSGDVIFIANISEQKVFVLGMVKKPGIARIKNRLTLLEAISASGGLAPDAIREEVVLVRGGLANPALMKINVEKILTEGDLSQDIELQNGDIVYVPEKTIASLDRFFSHITQIVLPFAVVSTGIRYVNPR